ncbi:FXYD domain-containing ion transport regulator 5-like [Canis lupus dingo]|uniref:FXYD domain-containing ion transport regulator 5-like n=1 Tax=Canis lupus familiaris TaxID=9615 RepID=UPI0018F7D589|nr:FXYD domain-containing ion transport regulator 5-like [Canis lupus familiaris]XP_048963667.1 FXYD domain-containing ion transport regulator 5-like [Canis lupus dingo]
MGLQTGGTTWEQMEGTQTPQLPEASELLAADQAMATMTTGKSSLRATPPEPTKGTTLSKRQSPGRDIRRDPPLRPTGSSEDDPFSYDEDTLRKRGLLVTAVLFITGIVILTSGKCRWLPQLCRNYNRWRP